MEHSSAVSTKDRVYTLGKMEVFRLERWRMVFSLDNLPGHHKAMTLCQVNGSKISSVQFPHLAEFFRGVEIFDETTKLQ